MELTNDSPLRSARKQPIGRPFEPGKSGNPGGRPAALAEVKALAREQTEANIAALVAVRDNPDSPAAARVSAANSLLDRGWGRPTQALEHSGPDGGPIPTGQDDAPWKGHPVWDTEDKWRRAGEACDNIFASVMEQHKRNVAAGLARDEPPSEADMEKAKQTIANLTALAKQKGEI